VVTVVTVVVGPGAHQVAFYPHEAALTQVRFFNTALTGPFPEAATRNINLSEDCPFAFEQILLYLYHGNPSPDRLDDRAGRRKALKAYLLADKLCMENCANTIVDDFLHYHREYTVDIHELDEVSSCSFSVWCVISDN